MLAKKSIHQSSTMHSKVSKNNGKPSKIIQLVHSITESEIHSFRNTKFDNMAVKLITSGHRQSFEFLELIVEKSLNEKEHEHNVSLVDDEEKLVRLRDYFIKAEDFCRDGRFNQVSQAYCEAATCEEVSGMYWLQELIMEKALCAAEKFKADGGRQLAYCQLQLANMLEASKVRKLRNSNIIYGSDYRVSPPKRCISLLEGCLEASIGRSQWLSNLVPFEYLCAGNLARLLLAENQDCEENLKRVIKLAEQANCTWLNCLGNFYLGKLLVDTNRDSSASVRLERGLEVVKNQEISHQDNVWSENESCLQAPSNDRLAGMCTCLLAKLKLRQKCEKSADESKKLLEEFLEKFSEVSDERADCYILLGELYDKCFHNPEKAVECYTQAFNIRPNINATKVALGTANGHLMLDSVMTLVCNKGKSDDKTDHDEFSSYSVSKRLLIWKDQPDDFEHDLQSD